MKQISRAAVFVTLAALGACSWVRTAGNDPDRYDLYVQQQLDKSTDPRDRMLVAESLRLPADAPARNAQMAKAAADAPDDALVQWYATATLQRTAADGKLAPDPERARRLAALAPDNAAHWLPLLIVQVRAKDPAGVDDTLTHMADAARFDEHLHGYVLAWLDAYARFPPPGATAKRARMVVFVAAAARLAIVPYASYQTIVHACDPATTGIDAASARAAHCERIARRMIEGPTLIGRRIGEVILRKTNRATPADVEAERISQWLSSEGSKYMMAKIEDPAVSEQWLDGWRDAGGEEGVYRRLLERAGLPTTPPPGWESAGPAPRDP